MTDIDTPSLIERLNALAGIHPDLNEHARAVIREAAEALSLTVSPLPSPGEAAAEAVCHDEQLEIWADEFVEHIPHRMWPDFESYGEKITYFSAVKDAIKDLVEKAFTHPELEKGTVSPIPKEIAELLERAAASIRAYETTYNGGSQACQLLRDLTAALEQMARENAELKAADRDHLTAHQGSVRRLETRIRELEAERDAIITRCMDILDIHGERRKAAIRALNAPPPTTTEAP